jgi:hypothetical protein
MRAKTMKIAVQANYLTVDVASSSPDGALVTRQEKLTSTVKKGKLLLSDAQGTGLPQAGQMMAKL